jgi:endo-1,4-beta-xylanase
MSNLSRRTLFAATLGAATSGIARAAEPDPGLHAHASRKGLFYGSAIGGETLLHDPELLARIAAECGIVVSEGAFKWASLHPEQDRLDFKHPDALMKWATEHKLPVRGHNLVWHEANPDWLEPALTAGGGEKLLTDHIKAVVGRYAGHVVQWDVINEPIDPDDKKPFNLRDTLWLRALGPAYLDIALHATEAADPKALRVINEYGTDYGIDWQERKRAALLELLADLVHRRVPVQAVGLQAHLDAGEISLDQNVLSRFVADIASLGLKIVVTEFDVRDQRLPADIPARDTAVAAHARAWLDAVLPNPAVMGVLSWGLSDRGTWLNDKFARPDGLPQRALPLDADLKRKKLWSSMAAAFDALPVRTPPIKS